MQVRLVSLFVVLAAAWAPPASADVPAVVRMLSCTPWEEGLGGSVTYAARMRSVPGTARMSLRIRLFEKVGAGKFERVEAEGLGIWRKSHPDASVFRYEQHVRGLHKGAIYRVSVRYRWLNAAGEPFMTAGRESPRCSQDGGLANLRVASIDVKRGSIDETAVYTVKVVNRGTAPAEDVGVLLRVDGEIVDEELIETLEPKEARTVTFNGPVCRERMRVVVDPDQLIVESHERDNVRDPSCV
jgi:CARDB